MARKTRLSTKIISQVSDLVRKRTKISEICQVIGVSYETFYRWRKRGEEESEGIYSDLVKSMQQAEMDLCEDLAHVVFNAALVGSKEYKKVTKVVQDAKGKIRTEETETETDTAPDANLALKLLERKFPNKWGSIQRISVNWVDLAITKGVDPQQLQAEFKQMFLITDDGQQALPNPDGEVDGSDT